MISLLNGIIVSKSPDEVVIECAGIGFSVCVPSSAYAFIADVGEKGLLYTHMIVKEDAMELYGFADRASKECFKKLIRVSGVGPKSAISILSLYTPDMVAMSIAAGDFKAFTACAGIGAKIAQRLVLELKDKIGEFGVVEATALAGSIATESDAASDAVAALISLGFSSTQAATAVSKLPADTPVDIMISSALKSMDKR